ncbi:MAG: amidohydrolase family protein, partial [Lachnospiraceae bacterium]|nr:amidohydrolase family protein [Lachnospiraceae bacterium]
FSVRRLTTEGDMDYIINLANEMGYAPIKTIKMASYNAARFFHLDHLIGSLTPGRYADIVLTDSLAKVNPLYVFKGGELIARDHQLLKNAQIDYSGMRTEGVPGLADLKPEDLDIRPIAVSEDGKEATVYLFDVFGRGHADFYREIQLPVENGKIVPVFQGQKLCRLSVIQRYAHGTRNVINGYFTGMYIGRGAVGTSFPAPVPYLAIAGMDSMEMWDCAQKIDQYSGACIAVENGEIKAKLPIEIYGMMADMTAQELLERTEAVDRAAAELGNDNTMGEPVVNKLLSLFISLHRFGFMKE